MDPYSETCVKHDRALRFITRDLLILNPVLLQDCSVLAVSKSKTFRKPGLELLKLLAKKGKLAMFLVQENCTDKLNAFSLTYF